MFFIPLHHLRHHYLPQLPPIHLFHHRFSNQSRKTKTFWDRFLTITTRPRTAIKIFHLHTPLRWNGKTPIWTIILRNSRGQYLNMPCLTPPAVILTALLPQWINFSRRPSFIILSPRRQFTRSPAAQKVVTVDKKRSRLRVRGENLKTFSTTTKIVTTLPPPTKTRHLPPPSLHDSRPSLLFTPQHQVIKSTRSFPTWKLHIVRNLLMAWYRVAMIPD